MAENLDFEEIEKQNPEGNKENEDISNQQVPRQSKMKKPVSAYILFMKELRDNKDFCNTVDKTKFLSEASKLWG